MRSLLLAFLLAAASLHDATAQIAEERLTLALDTLAQIAQDGDASLMAHMACLDHGAGVEGGRIAPCVYQGDPRMEDTAGAFVDAIYEALPPDGAWILDAVTTRTVEGRGLTEVQVKVRRDDEPVGQPVLLFADHATRPLLVQVNRGPSMLLADAPPSSVMAMPQIRPLIRDPDLRVQLPARAASLQMAALGEFSLDAALLLDAVAALIACRMEGGGMPIACSDERSAQDPAERVPQVIAEIDFALGDTRITPRTEAVVVPHEIEGIPSAQVQFEVNGRRPTLFFMEVEGAYLYVSAHPDMDPLTPPLPDAQPRLEALLADLLGWIEVGDAEAAAPHLVYRGDGPDRWQRALDPTDADDLVAARRAVRQLASAVGTYDAYTVTSYLTDTESEGTWHVLRVAFEAGDEADTVVFAFLLLDDVFVLGDVD
ncbi:MAG: hypothetical protein AAFN13_07080 [Bacteroidota bacterium]